MASTGFGSGLFFGVHVDTIGGDGCGVTIREDMK
jgi:hypothetical protein